MFFKDPRGKTPFNRVLYSCFAIEGPYLQFKTSKNLKLTEHVDIRVLEHPTTFQIKTKEENLWQ